MTVYRDLADVPSGRYSVIYADPPWSYTCWGKGRGNRAAANHYSVSPTADIAKMDVGRIAGKKAALLIWVTGPMLRESFDVMDAWGFSYSTIGYVWIKLNADGTPFMGLGHSTRSGAEVCLLAYRTPVPRESRREYEVIEAKVRRHSQKPPAVARSIELLYGDVPRIELFARGPPRHGWDAMGWEADGGATTIDAHLGREGGGD